MATKKKPEPIHVLTPSEADVALDLLAKHKVLRRRRDQYREMERDSRRKDGTQPPPTVRFVDQESRNEVLDVPVRQLIENLEDQLFDLNKGLARWCNLKVGEN